MAPRSSIRAFRDRRAIEALDAIRRRRSVVLGYHGIADSNVADDLSLLQVNPARFRAQLELLIAAGFRFVTVEELALLSHGRTPPPGLAAVTFDDGMRNNHCVALPILRALGLKATVYVTVDFIGGWSPWIGPHGDGSMMSEDELRDLARAGWEIGAHTITHADLSTLDYEACVHEIAGSRKALEDIVGRPVRTLAYPSGRYSAAAIAAARDAGMLAAVTTGSGVWAPYEMTRAMIGAADPLPVILLKLTDRYEPLLAMAPLRALRAFSRRLRETIRNRQAHSSSGDAAIS